MDDYDFRAAVAYALEYRDTDDLIEGVKRAVFDELCSLDPTASIEDTQYYNHSFIPDFILSWNDSGRRTNRQVFLRPSLLSTAAGHDIENLGHSSPVLLALKPSVSRIFEEATMRDIETAPDCLVTDVNAVADIAVDSDRPISPLRSLVRSNLVRGGRGLIVSDTARRLTSTFSRSTESLDELREFADIVSDVFVTDAATRLQRAVQLLEMGISGDLSKLHDEIGEPSGAISGKLSTAEMRVLLPYLLKRDDVTTDPNYWAHIGSMLTLEGLEVLAPDLADVDLTPLVVPNLERWSATRASAVLYDGSLEAQSRERVHYEASSSTPPMEMTEEDPGSLTETTLDWAEHDPQGTTSPQDEEASEYFETYAAIDPQRWHFHAKMLSVVVGPWRIYVTPNGRRLRGRDQSRPALWDAISERLRRFTLTGVVLEGLQRRVRVSSDRDVDVYQDVRTIYESIDDEFKVPEIIIRPRMQEGPGEIAVSFVKMLAAANVEVSASELTAIAMDLLTHSRPVKLTDIDRSVLLPVLDPQQRLAVESGS